MKRWDDFYNNQLIATFSTYLPIKLDASCNGFQHLALLSDEVTIFEELNLSESVKGEDPKDFYSYILKTVKIHLQSMLVKSSGKEKDRIIRLLQLSLKRSHIKPLIMTKPYNASNYTLTNYLAANLVYRAYGELERSINGDITIKYEKKEKIVSDSTDVSNLSDEYRDFYKYIKEEIITKKKHEKKDSTAEMIFSSSETSTDFVTRSDLLYYIDTFNSLLLQNYLNIKTLMEYLSRISDILSDRNLPII